MPSHVPADLRYPIVSYCNNKERNEVFVYTADDAVKADPQSYAPRLVLDTPMDITTLYVQLDDEGQPKEVLTSPTDPDDLNSELIMKVGMTDEHPLHYFVKHEDGHSSRHPYLYEMYIKEGLMHDIVSAYMIDLGDNLGAEVSLTEAQSDLAMFTSYQEGIYVKLNANGNSASLISTDSADLNEWDTVLNVRFRDGKVWINMRMAFDPTERQGLWRAIHTSDGLFQCYDLASICSDYALLYDALTRYSETWASDENRAYEVYALNHSHDRSQYADRPIVELPTNHKTAYIQLDADGRTPKYASLKAQDLRDDSNALVVFYWIADGFIHLTHDDTPSNKPMNLFNRYRISDLMS